MQARVYGRDRYTRIRGALSNLRHTVARSTIANILREHGIEPAPERGERTPWRTFLTAHWETIAATDFFTVEVATVRRLVTYYVLVVIELSSRKVHIAGITPRPDGAFMMQVGRNLTDPLERFLRGKRLLILDRDQKFTPDRVFMKQVALDLAAFDDSFLRGYSHLITDRDSKYTTEFREVLKENDVDIVPISTKSPNCNPHVDTRVSFCGSQPLASGFSAL